MISLGHRSIGLLCALFLGFNVNSAKAELSAQEYYDKGSVKILDGVIKAINNALKNHVKRERSLAHRAEGRGGPLCRLAWADYNRDNKVDEVDQKFFTFCFAAGMQGIACGAADLNRDQQIDLGDLIIFSEQLGKPTQPNLCLAIK